MDRTVFRSKLSDMAIPPLTIHDFVLERCADFGERVCIQNEDNSRIFRFRELNKIVSQVAKSLDFVRKGDVVAFVATNVPEYLIVFHAVLKRGGVILSLSPREVLEIEKINIQKPIAAFVITNATRDHIATYHQKYPNSKIINLEDGGENVIAFRNLVVAKKEEGESEDVLVTPDDVAILIPAENGDIVSYSHGSIVASTCQVSHPLVMTLSRDEVFAAVVSLYHPFSFLFHLCIGVRYGAKTVTIAKFNKDEYLKALVSHHVTVAHIIPSMIDIFPASLPSSLTEICIGGGPLPNPAALAANTKWNGVVRQTFGTIATGISHVAMKGSSKPTSCGVVLSNTQVRLMEDNGECVGVYSPAQLCVSGPQVPTSSAKVVFEKFVASGCTVIMDEDGQFYALDGEKKNLTQSVLVE